MPNFFNYIFILLFNLRQFNESNIAALFLSFTTLFRLFSISIAINIAINIFLHFHYCTTFIFVFGKHKLFIFPISQAYLLHIVCPQLMSLSLPIVLNCRMYKFDNHLIGDDTWHIFLYFLLTDALLNGFVDVY